MHGGLFHVEAQTHPPDTGTGLIESTNMKWVIEASKQGSVRSQTETLAF